MGRSEARALLEVSACTQEYLCQVVDSSVGVRSVGGPSEAYESAEDRELSDLEEESLAEAGSASRCPVSGSSDTPLWKRVRKSLGFE